MLLAFHYDYNSVCLVIQLLHFDFLCLRLNLRVALPFLSLASSFLWQYWTVLFISHWETLYSAFFLSYSLYHLRFSTMHFSLPLLFQWVENRSDVGVVGVQGRRVFVADSTRRGKQLEKCILATVSLHYKNAEWNQTQDEWKDKSLIRSWFVTPV